MLAHEDEGVRVEGQVGLRVRLRLDEAGVVEDHRVDPLEDRVEVVALRRAHRARTRSTHRSPALWCSHPRRHVCIARATRSLSAARLS